MGCFSEASMKAGRNSTTEKSGYYGYYEKAIGIYTHVSDQDAVFSTQVISCSPREALYVLDGLLNNNTVLQIREHTTDTHGYTEIVFALCHLLGFYFMPRIRDLKDQQLYRVDRLSDYGVFTSSRRPKRNTPNALSKPRPWAQPGSG